jgi:hypothetical protein
MTETIYQAYIETDTYSLYMEYLPRPDGLIEIVSVTIQPRAVSLFQQRRPKRRQNWNDEDPSIELENLF